ncbi:MAG: hypothetical protein KKB20_29170, partial [Proteobacteria bacterium]|nr:hypothetical protein [Pseudomonadota bacterium]
DAAGVTGVISPTAVLTIDKSLTINGPGGDLLCVDGGGSHRVLEVLSGLTVVISGLTVQNGYAVTAGGLFVNTSGSVTLNRVNFRQNTGLYHGGALKAEDAALTIGDCLFSGNRAAGGSGQDLCGGGLYLANVSGLTIDGSTFSDNEAELGGGLYLSQCTGNMVNSTISGNRADTGGGIYFFSWAFDVSYSTIAKNQADNGGGVFILTGRPTFDNTIISDNTGTSYPNWSCDFGGYPDLQGHNLIGDTNGCAFNLSTGDIVHESARLDDLADNGGFTPTHALMTGSPAIDNGADPAGVGLDQRDVTRPQNGWADGGTAISDIGAFELRAHGLSVAVTGDGSGRVVSDPAGLDCGDECHQGFRTGSTVTLTAEPNAWSRFDGFTGDCAGTGPCALTMNADKSLTAEFSRKTFTITAESNSGGSISPSGAINVTGGENQSFFITPDEGYRVEILEVDGEEMPFWIKPYTFKQVSADHTIRVTFEKKPFYDTYYIFSLGMPLAYGDIDPEGVVEVRAGDDQTFDVIPEEGYRIGSLLVDMWPVGATSRYTFRDVDEDHEIIAIFSPDPWTITAAAGEGGTISPSGAVEVENLESRRFTITPLEGYHIHDVLVDGESKGAVHVYNFRRVTADHAIEAVFARNEPAKHTINADVFPEEGGRINPSGEVLVTDGRDQTFQITARPGYQLVYLIVDGDITAPTTSYTFSNVTANHCILAVFVQVHAITATSGTGGTVIPAGVIQVVEGANQGFKIDPDDGYQIQDVVVDGESSGPIHYILFINVQQSHTIAASFSPSPPATYYLYTSAQPGEGGTVTPAGKTPMAAGADQQVVIEPNDGYVIEDVIVDDVSQGPRTSSVTFQAVSSDHTVTARFKRAPLKISAIAGAGGSIVPAGDVEVEYNADQAFTISPDAGYHIRDVFVDGISQGALATYTFYNVQDAHAIKAVFARNPCTIAASAAGGGLISPSGNVSVEYGGNQTFTISPEDGHRIKDVLVDGVSQGPLPGYFFSGVTRDHAIHAEFEENPAGNATINASAIGYGSITPSGNVTVPYGRSQSFTMTPAPGRDILQVYVDDVPQGPLTEYTFQNVTANHAILAVFTPGACIIEASAGSNGAISPSGAVPAAFGDDQDFIMTPDEGYHIDSVRVDGVEAGQVHYYRFRDVFSDHTIEAGFRPNSAGEHVINAVAGDGGFIAPRENIQVRQGDSATLTITADGNHRIQAVFVDGRDVGPVETYTFNNVAANHLIRAVFSALGDVTQARSSGGGLGGGCFVGALP